VVVHDWGSTATTAKWFDMATKFYDLGLRLYIEAILGQRTQAHKDHPSRIVDIGDGTGTLTHVSKVAELLAAYSQSSKHSGKNSGTVPEFF
jgi:ubiquinone/menaquinone biosynthesis C-methylase UbiE